MSRAPRGLSPEESALWNRLSASVRPLHPVKKRPAAPAKPATTPPPPAKHSKQLAKQLASRPHAVPQHQPAASPLLRPVEDQGSLDSHWERRLARTSTAPDVTLDLHGCTLDQAWQRLDAGLAQARAMDARLVLVITGKPRAVEAADRGSQRGAIRAKIIDWLAAGQHAGAITAIRPAHRRHGGEGALYLVLRRR